MPRRLLALALLAAWLAPAAHAARVPVRLLYASDWNGPMQIFALDPSGRAPLAQITFDRPGTCYWAAACGFTDPQPSPDGRWLVYRSGQAISAGIPFWLARADGSGARSLGTPFDASWAPDSRRLAVAAADGIHVVSAGGGDRLVSRAHAGRVRISPDGRTLALTAGGPLALLSGTRERVLARDALGPFAWSPDGRRIAYATREGISLADVRSGRTRLAYRADGTRIPFELPQLELAWSPDGRWIGFFLGATRVLDTRTLQTRTLTSDGGHDLAWSPDGRTLLYVQGGESSTGDSISTGDVRTVTLSGVVRTIVSAAKPYGGQIVAAAWSARAPGVRYRTPQPVDGVFAGGPVQEVAADGGRVAFIACGGVSAWTPATGAVTVVEQAPDCRAPFSRGHVYSLGLAGERLAWVEKGWGLCFQWDAREATLGGPTVALGAGSGCLGSAPPDGLGTAVGAGPLLVLSSWRAHFGPTMVVDEQTIERVEPGGCPCPAISSSPGPYTPLDVDAGRIVVSGENETRVLAGDGTILLSLRVPTLAAQLSGSDLVLAVGSELRVYDAASGLLRAVWPLPADSPGHDCDGYGDPSCRGTPALVLGDVARGLAAYGFAGSVHLLRLADGRDAVVGDGAHARFMDPGLVFADGARIRLVPWERLPLR